MALWTGVCAVAVVVLMATGSHSSRITLTCGRPPLNTRIVGGQDAVEGSWPWQASLHLNGSHTCGGSLINNKWVLSAAHCFTSNSDPADWRVYLGRRVQSGSNPHEESRPVSKIIPHDDYSGVTHENDIALLKLSSAVRFSDYIQPVCLAAGDSSVAPGTDSWVTGFGAMAENGEHSNTLQEVEVQVVSRAKCDQNYPDLPITGKMICAGTEEGGKDACQGDSGSPMMSKGGSSWTQTGIVNFGDGCARADVPGVYTRVSEYEEWIATRVTPDPAGFLTLVSGGASCRPFAFPLSLLPVLLVLCGWGR